MTVTKKISRRRLLGQTVGVALAGLALPGCPQDDAGGRERKVWKEEAERRRGEDRRRRRTTRSAWGSSAAGGATGSSPSAKEARASRPSTPASSPWPISTCDGRTRGRSTTSATAYQDYRALLDRKDVDVVVYATPEHWHYLPCIHACQAGKDIYGEQPLSHTIREGRVMVEAVRKYKRVFQTGEQQRSHPKTRKAVELILNGRIGKIQSIIGYNYPSPFECDFPAQPIPEYLDWDRWCGPNEVVPYHTDLYLSRIPYEPEPTFPARACREVRRRSGLDVVPALFRRRTAQLGLPRAEHGPVGTADGQQRSGRGLGGPRREAGEGGLRHAGNARSRGCGLQQVHHQLQVCQRRGADTQLHRSQGGRRGNLHRRQGPDHDLSRRVRVRSEGPRRRTASRRRDPCLQERQPHAEFLRLRASRAKTRS